MTSVKVLKYIRIETPPFSTNDMYGCFWMYGRLKKGRTDKYKKWQDHLVEILPENLFPSDREEYVVGIKVGVTKQADLDNTLKPLIDALQRRYKFNDVRVSKIFASKEIVKSRQDAYILIYFAENIDLEFSNALQVSDATPIDLKIMSQLSEKKR